MAVSKTLLLLLTALSGPASFGGNIDYISPLRQTELETLFAQAQFNPKKDLSRLREKTWTCSLYGIRSHMQIERGLRLYRWNGPLWHNTGAQAVSEYQLEASALVGVKARLEDQVKVTEDGHLVSRLSLSAAPKTILAYAFCDSL